MRSNSPPLGCTTTPRMPPSRTSRFEPRPMTKSGKILVPAKRISSAKARFVARLDPELRRTADAQRGVFRERFVKAHFAFFADDLLQLLRDHEIGREERELFVNVAGAEAENEIAGLDHVADIAMQPIESRLISRTAMSVRDDFIHDRLSADAGNRRFARRINVGDDDAIGIVKRAAEFFAQRLRARIAMRLKHRRGRACGRSISRSRASRGSRSDDARNHRRAGSARSEYLISNRRRAC